WPGLDRPVLFHVRIKPDRIEHGLFDRSALERHKRAPAAAVLVPEARDEQIAIREFRILRFEKGGQLQISGRSVGHGSPSILLCGAGSLPLPLNDSIPPFPGLKCARSRDRGLCRRWLAWPNAPYFFK